MSRQSDPYNFDRLMTFNLTLTLVQLSLFLLVSHSSNLNNDANSILCHFQVKTSMIGKHIAQKHASMEGNMDIMDISHCALVDEEHLQKYNTSVKSDNIT